MRNRLTCVLIGGLVVILTSIVVLAQTSTYTINSSPEQEAVLESFIATTGSQLSKGELAQRVFERGVQQLENQVLQRQQSDFLGLSITDRKTALDAVK